MTTGHGKEYVPPKYEAVGRNLSVWGAFRPIWPFAVGAGVAMALLLKVYRIGYESEELRSKSSKFYFREGEGKGNRRKDKKKRLRYGSLFIFVEYKNSFCFYHLSFLICFYVIVEYVNPSTHH